MKKILLPIDFSESSLHCLELSYFLARKTRSKIYLINVIDPVILMPSPAAFPMADSNFNAGLTALFDIHDKDAEVKLKKIKDKVPDDIKLEYKTVRSPSIYDSVIEYSEELKPNLIIVGSRGNTGLRDIVIGSNAERIVKLSKIPVMVISEKSPNKKIKKMLFASDFSEEAYKIFPSVKRFAALIDAEILLVKVNTRDNFRATNYNYRIINDFQKRYKLKSENFVYDDYVKEDGIIKYGKEKNADLIVLGTHGRRGLSRFFTENISGDLVNTSPLPVLTFNFGK